MMQFWFVVLASGFTLFGVAISVASKKMTWLGIALTVIGALGVGYYFYNGSQEGPADPPDVSTTTQ